MGAIWPDSLLWEKYSFSNSTSKRNWTYKPKVFWMLKIVGYKEFSMKHHRSCGSELAMSDTMWCGLSSLGLASSRPDDLEFVSVILYIHCMFPYLGREVQFSWSRLCCYFFRICPSHDWLSSESYLCLSFSFHVCPKLRCTLSASSYCSLSYLSSGINNCLIFLEKMLHSEDSQTNECFLLLALMPVTLLQQLLAEVTFSWLLFFFLLHALFTCAVLT